jgi:hypothetical protein
MLKLPHNSVSSHPVRAGATYENATTSRHLGE